MTDVTLIHVTPFARVGLTAYPGRIKELRGRGRSGLCYIFSSDFSAGPYPYLLPQILSSIEAGKS